MSTRTYSSKRKSESEHANVIKRAKHDMRSTPSSPSKLSNRMLGRSKTESSLDSSPSSSGYVARTPSLPAVLSPQKLPATQDQPASPSPSPKKAIKTYAGRSRSFLVPYPVDGELDESQFMNTESYASLRSRWGVDNSEDDPYPESATTSAAGTPYGSPSKSKKGKAKASIPDLEPGMMNPLKGISELRNKGESRRFLDEVGYLLEGMDEDAGDSLKRASALEITTKMCDPEFCRKARATDFLGRAWGVFLDVGSKDKTLGLIFIFFAALVAREPDSLSELATGSDSFVPTIFDLLSHTTIETDPLFLMSRSANSEIQLKKQGFSKSEQTTLRALFATIKSKSSLFPPGTPISTLFMITHILTTLPSSFLSSTHLPLLLKYLKGRFASLSDTPTRFSDFHDALRLLDTYLLAQWNMDRETQAIVEKAGAEWLIDGLVRLGVAAQRAELASEDDAEQGVKCTEMIFRCLVSLTHSDRKWCERFMEHEFATSFVYREIVQAGRARWTQPKNGKTENRRNGKIKKEEDQVDTEVDTEVDDDAHPGQDAVQALDRLCLTLGLWMNLVQVLPSAKNKLRDFHIDPSCPLSQSCLPKCKCRSPASGLSILVDVYKHHQVAISVKVKKETEALDVEELASSADASFLLGHLSLLLGLLMMDSEANQTLIIKALPEAGSRSAKLNRLIEQAKEVGTFYSKISRSEDAESDDGSGMMSRAGEEAAGEIILFLEKLRDRGSWTMSSQASQE